MLTYKTGGHVYVTEDKVDRALGAIFEDIGENVRPLFIADSKINVDRLMFMEFYGSMTIDCDKEPTYSDLNKLIDKARLINLKRRSNAVLVVGGGSAIDIGKAIAVLLNNNVEPIKLRGFDKVRNPGLPVIAIPTTLSGAEATNSASFIDTSEMRKMGINGRHMFASNVILDPTWLAPVDSNAFISTLLDALIHAYESGVCTKANFMTKPFSRMSFDTILAYMKDGTPADNKRLSEVQMAAYMSGRALCNSGSGIAGGLSYPLGVHYGVPHGIAGGVFLPYIMEFNGHEEEAAVVRAFMSDRKVPVLGWFIDSADSFIEKCQGLQPAFDQNPKKFTVEEDLPRLITSMYTAVKKQEPEKTLSEAMPTKPARRRK